MTGDCGSATDGRGRNRNRDGDGEGRRPGEARRRRVRRRWLIGAAAVVAGTLVTATGFAVAGAGASSDRVVLGPGQVTVELAIEHSRFAFERMEVRRGTTVRFVLRNDDPIGHELIVGDAEVHRLHASGTHAAHAEVPGEVSVGPGETASTTYTFDEVGSVRFACHLPGHVAYGMEGVVVVRP